MGHPGGMGGQGIVPATAIHRSLKPVRKKGKVLPSMMAMMRTDEDEDDFNISVRISEVMVNATILSGKG